MRWALLTLLVACADTINSTNPNLPTEEEKLTLWKVWDVPKNDWFAIGGADLNVMFIVGRDGRMLRFDSLQFTEVTSPTTENLYGIFMPSEVRGFAVGANGTILSWDGSAWKTEVSGTTTELRGVWCDDTRAFAVGADGVALIRMGGTWTPVMTDSPDDLYSIVRGSGNQPFAVGSLGTISTFNGMGFTRQPLAGFPKTLSAATAGPGGTFIGGVDGAVFNRANGQRIQGLQASPVRGITAPTSGLLFVAGWDGLLARVQGGTVLSYKDAKTTWLYGAWSASPADVWAVGADGLVLSGPPRVDPAP